MLVRETTAAAQQLESMGLPPVLLTPHNLRAGLSRLLRRSLPQLKVISHAEVPDSKRIKVTIVIGSK